MAAATATTSTARAARTPSASRTWRLLVSEAYAVMRASPRASLLTQGFAEGLLQLGPRDCAGHFGDDLAPSIEDDGRRHALHVKSQRRGIHRIGSRITNAQLLEKASCVVVASHTDERPDVDANENHASLVLVSDSLKAGHLLAARSTSSGPKVEDDRLPLAKYMREAQLVPSEDILALVRDQREVSRRLRGRW